MSTIQHLTSVCELCVKFICVSVIVVIVVVAAATTVIIIIIIMR